MLCAERHQPDVRLRLSAVCHLLDLFFSKLAFVGEKSSMIGETLKKTCALLVELALLTHYTGSALFYHSIVL